MGLGRAGLERFFGRRFGGRAGLQTSVSAFRNYSEPASAGGSAFYKIEASRPAINRIPSIFNFFKAASFDKYRSTFAADALAR